MNYEQKLKWQEMERLLPMLVKSLEKEKETEQLIKKVDVKSIGTGTLKDNDAWNKYKVLRGELETEVKYYDEIVQVVKGIRIGKGQITTKEAEALLYLIWLTDTSVTDFFDVYEYVPPVISSKIKKKYNGNTFQLATFSQLF